MKAARCLPVSHHYPIYMQYRTEFGYTSKPSDSDQCFDGLQVCMISGSYELDISASPPESILERYIAS